MWASAPTTLKLKNTIYIDLKNRIIFSQDNVAEVKLYQVYREPKATQYCGKRNYFLCCFDAVSVFFNNIVIVIGPTPPGTGVM